MEAGRRRMGNRDVERREGRIIRREKKPRYFKEEVVGMKKE